MGLGMFYLAVLCGVAGGAVLGAALAPDFLVSLGIRPGSWRQGVGVAGGLGLAGLGILIWITQFW